MVRNRPKRGKAGSSAAGSIVKNVCPRRDGALCAPLNQVLIRDNKGESSGYAVCSCGRRFPLTERDATRLGDHSKSYAAVRPAMVGDFRLISLDSLLKKAFPPEQTTGLAKRGVVPVGTPVLHQPTKAVPVIGSGLVAFCMRMVATMREAPGVGLAANQVGVPLKVITHALSGIAPQVMLNPVLWESHGTWTFEEGCLSMSVAGTYKEVRRPKKVIVSATLLDSRVITVHADEYFARVLQHELDHLEGIEYVQRLEGETSEVVYRLLRERGVDTALMPAKPYPFDLS